MGLSRSMLMNYLSEMKKMGAPIAYDGFKETYFYTNEVKFDPFFRRELDKDEMAKINAGIFFEIFFISPIILDPPLSFLSCTNTNGHFDCATKSMFNF